MNILQFPLYMYYVPIVLSKLVFFDQSIIIINDA